MIIIQNLDENFKLRKKKHLSLQNKLIDLHDSFWY